MNNSLVNAMTVDVEDYFQVSAFASVVSPSDWDSIKPRVDANTSRILEMFSQHEATATFFILGWVAERFPELVKEIAAAGHEVASHGYMHQRASTQTPEEFRQDIADTKKLLEDIIGSEVVGYRAPSFSISDDNLWAYDVLADVGYQYSSSIYPVVHDHYGMPDAPRFKFQTSSGVWEIPMSTLTVSGKNVPISGGGYFRLYPYLATHFAIKRFQSVDPEPYIFYMHPWEIDPDQPRQAGLPLKSRFRHYLNLSRFEGRLHKLLSQHRWSSMQQVFLDA